MSQGWLTLAEIDRRARRAKGTAFRAFKQLLPQLVETRDFRALRPDTDADVIAALRAAGRVYATSRVVVLLSPDAAQRVLDRLGDL